MTSCEIPELNGNSKTHSNGQIIYKWRGFHCPLWLPKGIVHKAVSRSTERRILSRIFQDQGTGFLCHGFARSYSQTCLVTSFLTPIRVHLLVLTHFMAYIHTCRRPAIPEMEGTVCGINQSLCRYNSPTHTPALSGKCVDEIPIKFWGYRMA